MKGADVAMASIVQYNDWLEEEVSPSNLCLILMHSFVQMDLHNAHK